MINVTASYHSKIFFRKLQVITIKPWPCWQQDSLQILNRSWNPQVYHRTPCPAVLICTGVRQGGGIGLFQISYLTYINQVIIWQCGLPYCTLPKMVFISPSVRERKEYICKLNWKESLLIYFLNWQGAPCSYRQSRSRMLNTFIIVNITP